MTLSESLVSFTLAACILTLTPGLDTVLVLRQLMTAGASSARKAALGVALVNVGLYMFSLAVIHVLLSLIWFMLLIAAGQTSMNAWRHPATGTWVNRVTGVILIGFGLKLGASDISFE